MTLRSVTLFLTLPTVSAWVTISQSYWGAQLHNIQQQMSPNGTGASSIAPTQKLGYLWHQPTATGDVSGLGGGITWAFDPDLCVKILSRFTEKTNPLGTDLVPCSEIRASVHRGFAAWADNSAKLHFIDVSERCHAWRSEVATRILGDCPYAEVFVTWLRPTAATAGRRLEQLHPDALIVAEAASSGGQTAALAQAFPEYTPPFRPQFLSTNGFAPVGQFVETTRATVSFNADLCWYLDSGFCSRFHQMKQNSDMSPDSILWLVRAAHAPSGHTQTTEAAARSG